MDAPYYNGDDTRDQGDPPDERCPGCRVGPDEPCEVFCDCAHCLRVTARREQDEQIDADNLAREEHDLTVKK